MEHAMNKPAGPTYDDIIALPENLVGEILNGELYTHPRPAPRHARAYSMLGARLSNAFDGNANDPGGWWILDEPELHLGRDVIVPDISGWRREGMPELPETAWFELAPDWACEILSPSTASVDRTVKMSIYAREAVPYLWLVDPDARTLEAYQLKESRQWLLLGTLRENDPVQQRPFETVSFPLGDLWA